MEVIFRISYTNRQLKGFTKLVFLLSTDQNIPSCLRIIIPSNGCGFPNSKSAHSPRTLTSEKTSNPPSNRKVRCKINQQSAQRKNSYILQFFMLIISLL